MGVCASKPADPALIEEGIDQSDAPQKGAQGKGGKSAKGPTSPSTMSRAMRRQSTNIGTPAPLRRGIPGPLALIARCGLRPALLMRLHDSFVVNTVVAFDIRLVLLLLYTYETKWALSAVLTIFICYITIWYWLGKFLGAWLAREPEGNEAQPVGLAPAIGEIRVRSREPAPAPEDVKKAPKGLGMVRSFVAYGPVGIAILDVLNLSTALGLTQLIVLVYELIKRVICPTVGASVSAAATVARSARASGGTAADSARQAASAALESGRTAASHTSATETQAIAEAESKTLVSALERRDLIGCFSAARFVAVGLVETWPLMALRLWITFRLAWTGKGDVSHMESEWFTYTELVMPSYCLLLTLLRVLLGSRTTGLGVKEYLGTLLDMGGTLPVHALVTNSLDKYALTYAPLAHERRALAAAIAANRSVRELSLADTKMGEEETEAVAHLVYNSHALARLDLRDNAIGDKGALALAEALRANTRLKELDMRNNSLSNASKLLLTEVWEAAPKRTTGLLL